MNPVVRERFKGLERALELQAKEYTRRLKDLNGEAGRLRQIQSDYLPREVFDRTMNEMKKEIEVLVAYQLKQQGKSQWIQVVPWILTVISLLFMYLNYKK